MVVSEKLRWFVALASCFALFTSGCALGGAASMRRENPIPSEGDHEHGLASLEVSQENRGVDDPDLSTHVNAAPWPTGVSESRIDDDAKFATPVRSSFDEGRGDRGSATMSAWCTAVPGIEWHCSYIGPAPSAQIDFAAGEAARRRRGESRAHGPVYNHGGFWPTAEHERLEYQRTLDHIWQQLEQNNWGQHKKNRRSRTWTRSTSRRVAQ